MNSPWLKFLLQTAEHPLALSDMWPVGEKKQEFEMSNRKLWPQNHFSFLILTNHWSKRLVVCSNLQSRIQCWECFCRQDIRKVFPPTSNMFCKVFCITLLPVWNSVWKLWRWISSWFGCCNVRCILFCFSILFCDVFHSFLCRSILHCFAVNFTVCLHHIALQCVLQCALCCWICHLFAVCFVMYCLALCSLF